MECPTAQEIVNGKYLTIIAESNLIWRVYSQLCEYWEDPKHSPQVLKNLTDIMVGEFNWSAEDFMLWRSKTLKQITEVGQEAVRRWERVNLLARELEEKRKLALERKRRTDELGNSVRPNTS
jgi:hypothetical protein